MNTQTDSAYKFGCGRYIQRHGALELAGQEALRLGRRAFIIGGPHTLPLVKEKLMLSLAASSCPHEFFEYGGPCSEEAARSLALLCGKRHFDLIIGAGGGRIMDIAKLTASLARLPVMNIPTSSATCAAYTPLSVVYTPEGKARGSWYMSEEVACILADMDILRAQPQRLRAAGIMDAAAKYIEISYHLRRGLPEAADVRSAAMLAKTVYEQLLSAQSGPSAGQDDEDCWNMVYLCIAAAGMVSGITRGAFQSALGHAFYEAVRTMWPRESASALHGEIVAVGLLIQEEFCGRNASFAELRNLMAAIRVPASLRELSLVSSSSDVEALLALPFFAPYVEAWNKKRLEAVVRSLL